MALKYYLDEQVQSAITNGLRARYIDVVTAQEDGHNATPDELILDRAASLGRVVFTQDADFLVEAHARQLNGTYFAGVVYAHQTAVSIGECIQDLELLAAVYELQDVENRVEYLPL